MLHKILAPLDGSELADAILPHVVALTRINGSTVTLLHVLETDGHSATGKSLSDVDPVEWHLRKNEAQAYLLDASQRLKQANLKSEQVVLEGRAAERIVAYAQKEDVDLVVLSSHGRGGLSGWNVSSIAQKVIHRVRKSTLIIPAHHTANQQSTKQQTVNEQPIGHRQLPGVLPSISYKRILVPLDGSPRAECVLPVATALARTHGAELILTHVVTNPEMFQRMPLSEEEKALVNQVVERNRVEAHRYFEQLQARLSPKPTTRILKGDNVEYTLLDLVETEAIDLVILAAHGYTGHNGGAYGRLAARFIEHGSVPLYVHQDLSVDEIKPLYAEQMINNLAPKREQHINAYDYSAN